MRDRWDLAPYGLVYRFPFFTQLIRFGLENERGVGHVASQTGLIALYRTLKRCHFPSTPLSVCVPASSNPRPAPATRSFTVLETRTSFALALEATLEAVWTAIPPTSSSINSHSPVWMPARISIPISRTESGIQRSH